MEKAKELLKETNPSVAAICEKVGYSDLKHFTVIQKATGLSPMNTGNYILNTGAGR